MGMNPFELKPKNIEETYVDIKNLSSKPYNKNSTDPYTKLRVILANGAEFEQVWFGHQLSRRTSDNELRRQVAAIRRSEQQQQKRISSLKPINESILEHTIGYEMLAVDLTIALAKHEENEVVQKALNFALLEDFDHLYRYANLLEEDKGIKAEKLVGKYVEIMPGRPTISEHRHPHDDIRNHITDKDSLLTKLNVGIITAAEQQTMNYYMNNAIFYDNEMGRKLYSEIAMIEEQHVTQYGGLMNTKTTWLECLLMHEYTECYLYYSNYETETDERIKALWEELFEQEVAHLHKAANLLQEYDNKQWEQIIPDGTFPELLKLTPDKEYLRGVIKDSVYLTADKEDYIEAKRLGEDSDFYKFQQIFIKKDADVPSHKVIKNHIAQKGEDYRYQKGEHPTDELNDRKEDNTSVGRITGISDKNND